MIPDSSPRLGGFRPFAKPRTRCRSTSGLPARAQTRGRLSPRSKWVLEARGASFPFTEICLTPAILRTTLEASIFRGRETGDDKEVHGCARACPKTPKRIYFCSPALEIAQNQKIEISKSFRTRAAREEGGIGCADVPGPRPAGPAGGPGQRVSLARHKRRGRRARRRGPGNGLDGLIDARFAPQSPQAMEVTISMTPIVWQDS